MNFEIQSDYVLCKAQIESVGKLVTGIESGQKFQTLLGVTGSGKTFTVANVIKRLGVPTLVLAHNKTLAAQLYDEFKTFFPQNRVEYFVSYYDYYQPESYNPNSDIYLEKDAQINAEIDKLRHSATTALFERRDVIVVASVSAIYGLGDPIDYKNSIISLRVGNKIKRDELIRNLIDIQYERTRTDLLRSKFRVRGDCLEIFPASLSEVAFRVEIFGDEIEKIYEINATSGDVLAKREHVAIFPASHFVTSKEKIQNLVSLIKEELKERLEELQSEGKSVAAERLLSRINFDIEMLSEMGFCHGIENYSRLISGREKGSAPFTLFDHFPKEFLLIIDESHVTVPQIRSMYSGDRARKKNLIEHGFRLPSAYDNRPLKFDEFYKKINQAIFVSATPSDYEKENSTQIVEQVVRPTGLLDPQIYVRPANTQVDDLKNEIKQRILRNERTLVTTLTKHMAEKLGEYLKGKFKVTYIHSDVKTLERVEIIRDLRLGVFDVLIGVNLLREGLDMPEVSLVAILDADCPGFLRSETSLIQTIGRAARHINGTVIMYGNTTTPAMKYAIDETNRRRNIQSQYNIENNIVPTPIVKKIIKEIRATFKFDKNQFSEDDQENSLKIKNFQTFEEFLVATVSEESKQSSKNEDNKQKPNEIQKTPELHLNNKNIIVEIEKQMKKAAKTLNFELAAKLRDRLKELMTNSN